MKIALSLIPLFGAFVLFSACSETEFSGGSPLAKPEKSEDATEAPAEELPTPPPEEEAPPPPETVDPPLVEESAETCITRDAAPARIDFEASPAANSVLTNQLLASHGVLFSTSLGQPVVRRTSRRSEAEPPTVEEAWMCILCTGLPRRNRLVDAAAETAVGRFVLSSTAAAQEGEGKLRIDYRIPVAALGFDLIDVDGDEVWLIEAFDSAGRIFQELTQSVSKSGYLKSRTGNGTPTRIDVRTADGLATIRGVQIRGAKPFQKFGFAFDNFDTGVPRCD